MGTPGNGKEVIDVIGVDKFWDQSLIDPWYLPVDEALLLAEEDRKITGPVPAALIEEQDFFGGETDAGSAGVAGGSEETAGFAGVPTIFGNTATGTFGQIARSRAEARRQNRRDRVASQDKRVTARESLQLAVEETIARHGARVVEANDIPKVADRTKRRAARAVARLTSSQMVKVSDAVAPLVGPRPPKRWQEIREGLRDLEIIPGFELA